MGACSVKHTDQSTTACVNLHHLQYISTVHTRYYRPLASHGYSNHHDSDIMNWLCLNMLVPTSTAGRHTHQHIPLPWAVHMERRWSVKLMQPRITVTQAGYSSSQYVGTAWHTPSHSERLVMAAAALIASSTATRLLMHLMPPPCEPPALLCSCCATRPCLPQAGSTAAAVQPLRSQRAVWLAAVHPPASRLFLV